MFKLPEWKYLKYNIQHKWSQMNASKGYSTKSYKGDTLMQRFAAIRILISTNPMIKISVCSLCLILIVSLVSVTLFSGGPEKVNNIKIMWFYDMNTGELFTADKTELPPIETPSGSSADGQHAGVIANVLTYDPTGEDADLQFVAYLEKLTNDGITAWEKAFETETQMQMKWETGRLIKRVDDTEWVEANSPKGLFIRNSIYRPNENGVTPQQVLPE
jgi:hypothetical protein